MPPKTKEQKDRAKALHKQKQEEKSLAKERAANQKESEDAKAKAAKENGTAIEPDVNELAGSGDQSKEGDCADGNNSTLTRARNGDGEPCLTGIPLDAMANVMAFLPAKHLGALILTCRSINATLAETKAYHLYTRLNHPTIMGGIKLCQDSAEAQDILQSAMIAGGDTKRVMTKKSRGKLTMSGRTAAVGSDEYPAYCRFVEEAVIGCTMTGFGGRTPIILPRCVNGRVASCSPEHTLCRAYGGHISGAGGSGVASWGVGNRGQLGHGKRKDQSTPYPLMGGIGYKIRIVQVSAGGGLVRVAHSLLLTDLGKVLSFGTGQYGQLGHGFQSGKQLPDEVRPRFIDALSRVRVTCVSAGELHSAVVTEDGDLYTWGDGFCGQLGHADKRPQLTPKQVLLGGMEDECAMVVSCGARHTLVNTEEGEVLSFGLGHFGVLGRAFTPYQNHHEEALADIENVTQALAGVAGGASLAQAQAANFDDELAPGGGGEAFLSEMSDETRVQLSLLANITLDDTSDQLIPVRLDMLYDVNIVGVSAGHRHSLVLDDKGTLYSFGSGLAGCLGHGDSEKQEYPMIVNAFVQDGIRISQMSAGVDMSMAVSTEGTVYAWGKTKGGRIGLSTGEVDVAHPRTVPLPATAKAVDVECGYVHSVIVTVDGTVHMCGGVGIDGADDGLQGELHETGTCT
jgi:alpha-tubulin suppressor-like RCC1 family protein